MTNLCSDINRHKIAFSAGRVYVYNVAPARQAQLSALCACVVEALIALEIMLF